MNAQNLNFQKLLKVRYVKRYKGAQLARANAVEQAPWTAEGQAKRQAVQEMFADIAPTYDLCNSLMSVAMHHRWRTLAVATLELRRGDTALDLCSGTGDFLRPLRKRVGDTGKVFGLDFCEPMLRIAAKKCTANGLSLGDACRLPVTDSVADAATVGWGIRNVPDIDAAHREIARVLKSGGRFVSLDMATPQSKFFRASSTWVFNTVVPLLGRLVGKRKAYTYLPKSTQRFWTREDLKASMERAGFADVRYRDLFFGNICMHYGVKR